MTSDADRSRALSAAAGRPAPSAPTGFALRRDDFGAFRALVPGSNDLVVLRPTVEGLRIERREGPELFPWDAVESVVLSVTDAGRAQVPTTSVQLVSGVPIDFADALAPGADELPLTLGTGRNHLLRVERFRMLTAVIASAAGLAPATTRLFHRGPRGVEVPELATRPRVLPRWAPPLMLAGSVVAFWFLIDQRWLAAVLVTGVLLCHEMGHAAVMRLCGMKVRGIVFVPLFGAATLTEHAFKSRWDEARVTLAGPLTGLPTAGALALAMVFAPPAWLDRDSFGMALFCALAINSLNLIPVLPLDGGRVLTCLAAGLPPSARAIVALLPIAALGGLTVLFLPTSSFLLPLTFLVLALSLTRVSLRRQSFHGWFERLPQPLAAVRSALRDVTHAFGGRAREDVDGGVPPTPLTAGQTVAVVFLYAVEALALLVAVALFLHAAPGVLDVFRPEK